MAKLNVNDPKVIAFLAAWQENRDMDFKAKGYDNIIGTPTNTVAAKQRTKYIALNLGNSSGHFICDRETEQVYSIKAYGVPNLAKPRGTIEFLTAFIKQCTEKGEEYTHKYWYSLHLTE